MPALLGVGVSVDCILLAACYRLGIDHILLVSRGTGGTTHWDSFAGPSCGYSALIVAAAVEAVTIQSGLVSHPATTLVSP